MNTRLKPDPKRYANVYEALLGLKPQIERSTLEAPLLGLIKVRGSQLNGCAYCTDMHTKDARTAGETEQRLYLLTAWHEAPFYTERERAALAWTEAMTRIGPHGLPDEVYDEARRAFSDDELVALALAVAEINAWNRVVMPFAADVGSYRAPRRAQAVDA